jgi:hypothetical protein
MLGVARLSHVELGHNIVGIAQVLNGDEQEAVPVKLLQYFMAESGGKALEVCGNLAL